MRSGQPGTSHGQDGQALLEFAIASFVLITLFAGAGGVLYSEWQRTRCAHLVFDQTHAALQGRFRLPSAEVRITEASDRFTGAARCGRIIERVSFRKLEHIPW